MCDYEKCKYYLQEDVSGWHGDVYDHPSYVCYCTKDNQKKQLVYPEGQCKRCLEQQDKMKNKVDRLSEVINKIEPGKITILTGSNGSGKSLIRKQLCFKLARKIEGTNYNRLVVDVSMQRRTESNPNLGALSTFMHDCPECPTSLSTFEFIETLFNSFVKDDNDKRYIVIDEPEIGMSRESQLGFILWLKDKLPEILDKTYGLLVITHSELIVDKLKEYAEFINIDKECTADEWINREIIPTDFSKLKVDSDELYKALLKS